MRLRPAQSSPLRQRNFLLLLSTDIVSTVGNGISGVALPFGVLASGGTATDIGYVLAALLVPMLFSLLYGGVIADRLPRTQVLIAAELLQAGGQGAFGALVIAGHPALWLLAVLAGVSGVGRGLQFPAAQGLIPQTVDASQLSDANSLNRLGMNSAQIGGFALGGILVAGVGPGWGLVADGATFLVGIVFRLGMRIPKPAVAEEPSFVHELREGWQAFSSRQWLWSIVLQFAFLMLLFVGAFEVLGPVVAKNHLHGGGGWGLVLTLQGIGAVVGALLTLVWKPRRLLLAAELSIAVLIIPTVFLAIPVSLPVMCVATFFAGISIEIFAVNWTVAMQQQIPQELLSRASSYDALGSMLFTPVGSVIAGPIAAAVGISATLYGMSALMLVFCLLIFVVPDVRNLRRLDGAPTAELPLTVSSYPA